MVRSLLCWEQAESSKLASLLLDHIHFDGNFQPGDRSPGSQTVVQYPHCPIDPLDGPPEQPLAGTQYDGDYCHTTPEADQDGAQASSQAGDQPSVAA